MTYPYKVEMWQYTDRGRVPGIEGNVDINVYMPDMD
jgi:GH25 family lysozyme M1 (1,4-beta-N-acetylmuramidase)